MKLPVLLVVALFSLVEFGTGCSAAQTRPDAPVASPDTYVTTEDAPLLVEVVHEPPLTRAYVEAMAGTGAILLDTRKTIPGLRLLEKYAARMGGAENHRMRMDDGLLIKDNHVGVCGGVAAAVRAAKAADTGLPIQVEVDRIDQIEPALDAGADRLLLDNMPPPVLREAVALVAGRVPLEASGGVRLDTIRAIAESGVTYVSVGRITQSAPAVDIGLDYELQ